VLSGATVEQLATRPPLEPLGAQQVKGREAPVQAFRLLDISVEES
jgi:class 3 adenylate cyclase